MNDNDANQKGNKLGTAALTGIVLSAMLGGGVFSLPQNMAEGSSSAGVIVAWLITAIGMSFIANAFRLLTELKPECTTGLYSYAKEGLGSFAGFVSAFGYWISNCFSLVAYAVLMMSTLSIFFPVLNGGNSLLAIIISSVITWGLYFLTLRGVEESTFVNNIGTILKIAILVIFIIVAGYFFKFDKLATDFLGHSEHLGSFSKQVKSTMLVTLWLFFGIEGAVVVSGRAKSQHAVKKATTLGFFIILAIYAIISLLPYGIFSQQELAHMANPSLAVIMQKLVGTFGAKLINIGIFIAIASSWIVWLVMVSEMPTAAAHSEVFPRYFKKQNKNGAYQHSLLVSTIIVQVMLFVSYFFTDAWNVLINITASMVLPCYLFSMIYLYKLALNRQLVTSKGLKVRTVFTIAVGAIIYTLWLIYAANLKYVVSAFLLYLLGLPLYIYARKQNKKPVFNKYEKYSVIILVIISILGVLTLMH